MTTDETLERLAKLATCLDADIGTDQPAGDVAREAATLIRSLRDERDAAREALRPFAKCKIEAPYGDSARTRLRIKIGTDSVTAEQFNGPSLGDFRRARNIIGEA